ncbi:MAG: outer membrane beta-barrel protein [Candidatus Aminicenantes bacterium]|nr:outer membrane beta-barrel protein [Candidatus Aminicenantes bacterium]
MTIRKLTIAVVIICLFSITALGKSSSKLNFFIHTGISIPSYPSLVFASFYDPAVNIGGGMNLQLSPKLSLTIDFNHYRFKANKIKDSHISSEVGDKSFITAPLSAELGDVKSDFNDLVLNLKIKPFYTIKRLSPYFLAGAGVTFIKVASYLIGNKGNDWYKSHSTRFLINAGFGLEYRISKDIDIFLEACYNYCFLTHQHMNIIPLKLGVALGL